MIAKTPAQEPRHGNPGEPDQPSQPPMPPLNVEVIVPLKEIKF